MGREVEVCHDKMKAYCQMLCEVPNIIYDVGNNEYATNAHLNIRIDDPNSRNMIIPAFAR